MYSLKTEYSGAFDVIALYTLHGNGWFCLVANEELRKIVKKFLVEKLYSV